MKRRSIALVLALALLTALLPVACLSEADETPAVSLKLGLGETYKIDASLIAGAEGHSLIYKSSNDKYVAVSADGTITAKKRGKTVRIGVGYDNTLLALYKVSVQGAPKSVKLSQKNAALSVGDTLILTASLPKKTASAITYSTANAGVATVDDEGVVTAVGGGKTTITATTFNNRSASCTVYVLAGKAPTQLSLNVSSVSIQPGEEFKLTPSVDEGSDAFYRFSSMNRKIATVSSDGVIRGVKKGATDVTVVTHNGLSQTVSVNVTSRRIDVYGALTKDPETFVRNARKLKLEKDAVSSDESAVAYYNSEMAMVMNANSCRIALNATMTPRYCVQGVDTSMTPEEAVAKLVADGWSLTQTKTSDGVEQRTFTRGDDASHSVTLATADNTSLRGIACALVW